MPNSNDDPDKRTDDIDYPYHCEECGRGFLTKNAHNAHQRVHADDDEVIEATDGGVILDDDDDPDMLVADGGRTFVDLTAFQRDILAACSARTDDEAPNGKQIRAALEEWGYDDLQSGRFYPGLDRLVEFGLISKRRDEEDGRHRRYAPTDAGHELLATQAAFLQEAIREHHTSNGNGPGEVLATDGGDADA